MIEFRLPDIGEGTSEAELLEWMVQVGDAVEQDQPLAEVDTDKAIVVLPSPAAGTVAELCAEVGDVVAVGAVLIRIAPADVAVDLPSPSEAGDFTAEEVDEPPSPGVAPSPGQPEDPSDPGPRPPASPAVRRLARELSVALEGVGGSGPGGRIVKADVKAAAIRQPGEATTRDADADGLRPGAIHPLRGPRRAIARTVADAWREVPHVTDYREVDVEALLDLRVQLRESAAGKPELQSALTLTPILIKLAAAGLREHPLLNASIDIKAEEIRLHEHCDVGVATATQSGLMVPVVRQAESKSISELALEVAELSRAARQRELRREQMQGATFTVNNYGALGIWLGTPLVIPPQVANLGFGAIRRQVVPVGEDIEIRRLAAVACSGDHRLVDGDTLAGFVTCMTELIEAPQSLLGELR